MLDEDIAQKLINQFSETTEYNINIMNEHGIIIASGDKTRIGSFHETAYRMLMNNKPVMEVYDNETHLGTKKGINMLLYNKNSIVGVVGITGNPDVVRPLAAMLKAAVESLLELELQQKKRMERISSKDRFFQQLLYLDEPDANELDTQAKELGYDCARLRIPILFQIEQEQMRDMVAECCKKAERHTKQDILIRTADDQVLVFLQIQTTLSVYEEYRHIVEMYIDPIRQFIEKHGITCRYLVGTLQDELCMYHVAYKHCKWLKKNSHEKMVFFYDYISNYSLSCMPLTEHNSIFKAYVKMQPPEFWNRFMEIISVMTRNNNNMVKSAAELHMHKNTLAYRFNHIRETLSLDPINKAEDNLFALHLCYYLSHL